LTLRLTLRLIERLTLRLIERLTLRTLLDSRAEVWA
jgi:hypothetical protein